MLAFKSSCAALLLLFISVVSSLETCRENCRGLISRVFSQGNVTLLTYTSTCPLYNEFKTCFDNKPAECRVPGPDDIIVNIFNYTCGEGKQKIIRTGECWSRSDVVDAIRTCSGELVPGPSSEMCSVYNNYFTCLKTSVMELCGQEAYEVLTEFASETTRAERQRYGCPDPQIVRPPLNIPCFDCHSGSASWPNTHCTVDGYIDEDWVGISTCSETCFAKTTKWNPGVIYRGCSTDFLPEEYTRPLPRFGCRTIQDETWCFCDGVYCNSMPMVSYV